MPPRTDEWHNTDDGRRWPGWRDMPNPDPTLMIKFCREVMPGVLTDACDVKPDLAQLIGDDVLARAEAFAALPFSDHEVLVAPFVEEVFDHEPLDTSLGLRAMVTVVVRNSLLEQAHHDGDLNSGIVVITRYAAGPLSHFLASRRRNPINLNGPNPFRDLSAQYPRAWACLTALSEVFSTGGRQPLRLPTAPLPQLPFGDELATPPPPSRDTATAVSSAIDPRFDQHLLTLLQQATQEPTVLYTSALSRYSRNSAKLHRVLEFLLAHKATILTTNYLIRPGDVWVRRGDLVKPNSRDPYAGIADTRGLSGTHRNLANTVTTQLRGDREPG
jgi:hypothetical protein